MAGLALRPCPFCASTALRLEDTDPEFRFVFCLGCGAEGPVVGSRDNPIKAWNRRDESAGQSAGQSTDSIAAPSFTTGGCDTIDPTGDR